MLNDLSSSQLSLFLGSIVHFIQYLFSCFCLFCAEEMNFQIHNSYSYGDFMAKGMIVVIIMDIAAIIAAAYAAYAAWRAQRSVRDSRSSRSLDSFKDSHERKRS